ncbi:hypothetical protein [Lewinella sp. LCG006]|uniref:hypothetical protein n=1 Tax=Lewinella sp. LCG006 TaxID=3231911 RepID=UPI0034616541
MNKQIVIAFLFLFIFLINVLEIKAQELGDAEVEQLINSVFSKLITGNATNSLGSFVGVDLSDSKIEYSPTFRISPGKYLNISANGGISNGVFNAIKNSSLNSNVGVGAQLHFLDTSSFSNVIRYREVDRRKYHIAREKLLSEHYLDSLNLVYNKDLIILNNKIELLDSEIKTIVSLLEENNDSDKRDSLKLELEIRKYKTQHYREKAAEMASPLWKKREFLRIGNQLARKLDTLDSNLFPITGFNVRWFSFGYEANNDAFKFYDPSQNFSDQVAKRNATSHGFNIQLSTAKLAQENFQSIYATINLQYQLRNNIDELTKLSIVDSRQDTSVSGDIRTIQEEITALTGVFEEDINALIVNYNIYSFFGLGNRFALHLNPKVEFADKRKPLYDLEVGILLSIPKKDELATLFNAELFYKFYDLSNNFQSEISFIERNSIGLKLTFPIAFNSLIN